MLRTALEIKKMSFGWALLLIWGCFLYLNAQYRHLHFDQFGNLVSHSHFTGDKKSDHQHSDDEFYWLDILSNPSFGEAYSFIPELLTNVLPQGYIPLYRADLIKKDLIYDREARGPPSFV